MNGTQGVNNTKATTAGTSPRLVFVEFFVWLTGVLGPGPFGTCVFIISCSVAGVMGSSCLGVSVSERRRTEPHPKDIHAAASVQINIRWSKRTVMQGREHGRCQCQSTHGPSHIILHNIDHHTRISKGVTI
jgi:hypothetical protein